MPQFAIDRALIDRALMRVPERGDVIVTAGYAPAIWRRAAIGRQVQAIGPVTAHVTG
jgi:hypothetical protein